MGSTIRNSLIGSLIVLGILAVVNFLSSRHFSRLDLTENKEYTVSPATREILAEMDDLVTVRAYFSGDLPAQIATLERDVRDVLNEYRAYSKGNLRVEFKDPDADAAVASEAQRLGIPQVPLEVIEQDRVQLQNVYLGMAVTYEDRDETIPVVANTQNLEYELTSRIVKVRRRDDVVLGYLTGHQEPGLFEELDQLRQLLEQQFVVRTVDLDSGRKEIPEDVNALVVAGPVEISEREKYLIDQFVMQGGKLLVFEDSIQLVGGQLQARGIRSGLENLLPHYGIKVSENVVLDGVCAEAGFNQGMFRFFIPYPYWPKVTNQSRGLNPENPIVSRLESAVFPWPCEVAESEQRPEGVEFTPLAWTSDRGWTQSGVYNLNPQQPWAPEETQSYTLAAVVSGSFPSYFAGKEVPAAPADTTAAEGELAVLAEDAETITESTEPSQIVVIGSSFMVRSNFAQQFPENLVLAQNAVDWLTLGNALISIRSRAVSDRPLEPSITADEAQGRRRLVKFAGTFAMPILLGIVGIGRWMVRRREKQAFQAELERAS